MKTAISIPESTFEQAEELARRLGVSRSRLFTIAVERFIESHVNADVTRRLNEVYSETSSDLDPLLTAMQMGSLEREDW
jgi:metal-responsive CopG/Arc/MetJ family transcriptional regulator